VLKYLKGSSQSVTRVGEEQVRGAHTTHYRAQVDLQRAVQQGVFGQATAAFPVDVWIDDQGRASRTSYSMKAVTAGSFSFTQELYDFGKADVSGVTAPPADQTRDISSLTKAAAGTTTG